MDADTLTALRASIRHWEEIVALGADRIVEEAEIGPRSCALCRRFWPGFVRDPDGAPIRTSQEAFMIGTCDGCPVKAATGNDGCVGSPHEDVDEAGDEEDGVTMLAAAERELAFLRSLLPPTKEPG